MASCSGASASGQKRPRKIQKEEDDSSSDESESSNDASDESFDEDLEIPVEFEAFPPAKCDFKSMKNLLKQLFLKNAVNLSELADLIISQDKVGSIIKVVDDEDEANEETNDNEQEEEEYEEEIYGITTVLDFAQHKEKQCIQQIKNMLLDKCKSCSEADTQKRFGNLLNGRIGLLISERFINIPPQVAPPLYKSLRGELQVRHKKDKSLTLDHLLLISKSYKEKETPTTKKKKGKKGKKSKKEVDEHEGMNFSNVEDEIFIKESSLSFHYPAAAADEETLLGGKWGYDDAALDPYRTVMIIPYKRLHGVIEQIEEFIGT